MLNTEKLARYWVFPGEHIKTQGRRCSLPCKVATVGHVAGSVVVLIGLSADVYHAASTHFTLLCVFYRKQYLFGIQFTLNIIITKNP